MLGSSPPCVWRCARPNSSSTEPPSCIIPIIITRRAAATSTAPSTGVAFSRSVPSAPWRPRCRRGSPRCGWHHRRTRPATSWCRCSCAGAPTDSHWWRPSPIRSTTAGGRLSPCRVPMRTRPIAARRSTTFSCCRPACRPSCRRTSRGSCSRFTRPASDTPTRVRTLRPSGISSKASPMIIRSKAGGWLGTSLPRSRWIPRRRCVASRSPLVCPARCRGRPSRCRFQRRRGTASIPPMSSRCSASMGALGRPCATRRSTGSAQSTFCAPWTSPTIARPTARRTTATTSATPCARSP